MKVFIDQFLFYCKSGVFKRDVPAFLVSMHRRSLGGLGGTSVGTSPGGKIQVGGKMNIFNLKQKFPALSIFQIIEPDGREISK